MAAPATQAPSTTVLAGVAGAGLLATLMCTPAFTAHRTQRALVEEVRVSEWCSGVGVVAWVRMDLRARALLREKRARRTARGVASVELAPAASLSRHTSARTYLP
jgi:hypothetical protein